MVPSVTCSANVEVNVGDNPGGFTQELGAVGSPGPILAFKWTILFVPAGGESARNAGDFTSGQATGQNVDLVIPGGVVGTFVVQCVASNSSGDSNPLRDAAGGQQCVVVKSADYDLPYPGDYQFDHGRYIREALAKIEAALP